MRPLRCLLNIVCLLYSSTWNCVTESAYIVYTHMSRPIAIIRPMHTSYNNASVGNNEMSFD